MDTTTQAQRIRDIDAAAAAIYNRFAPFELEYQLREAQAAAFRDAGYTGTVPDQVAAFATPAGIPAQQAADIILAQAAQLRGALTQLGVLRMRKFAVQALHQAGDDEAARTLFAEVMAQIYALSEATT